MGDTLLQIILMLVPKRYFTAPSEAGETRIVMCMNAYKFLPNLLGSLIAALFWKVL